VAVQHYQAGFQSDKSTRHNSFAPNFWKNNKNNIPTHKAQVTYDTIKRIKTKSTWHRQIDWIWRYRGEARLQKENICGLRKQLQPGHLTRSTKFIIYILLQYLDSFSPAVWQWGVLFTKKKENQLAFERKVLRTICGTNIENGMYRRCNFDPKTKHKKLLR
jgi:hypothetical protein